MYSVDTVEMLGTAFINSLQYSNLQTKVASEKANRRETFRTKHKGHYMPNSKCNARRRFAFDVCGSRSCIVRTKRR